MFKHLRNCVMVFLLPGCQKPVAQFRARYHNLGVVGSSIKKEKEKTKTDIAKMMVMMMQNLEWSVVEGVVVCPSARHLLYAWSESLKCELHIYIFYRQLEKKLSTWKKKHYLSLEGLA